MHVQYLPQNQQVEHQPFYCEENVHRLAQRHDLVPHPSEVVFITNTRRQVACWHQRAAEPDEPLVWDYHVVLLEHHPEGPRIWDLDTRLPCPLPAHLWVDATFNDPAIVRVPFHPRFRVVATDEFLAAFATDRSHMRTTSGRFRKPPPPWDPPGAPAMNLESFVDLNQGPGRVFDRSGFVAHLGSLAR